MPAPAWAARPTESGTYQLTVKVKADDQFPNDDDLAWANARTVVRTVEVDISQHCRIVTFNGRKISFANIRENPDIVVIQAVKQ